MSASIFHRRLRLALLCVLVVAASRDANAALFYDARHRLTSVAYPTAAGENRTYQYDDSGNLTAVLDGAGQVQAAYTYSAQNFVLSETSQGVTHRYGYDVLGNRLWVQYGNPGGGAARELVSTYDNRQRLASLSEGGRLTSYAYDGNGNLITKTLPDGELIQTTYDGLNRRTTEEGLSGATSLYRYVMLYDQVGNLCLSSEVTQNVAPRVLVMTYDGADRLAAEFSMTAGATFGQTTLYTYDNSNNRLTKTIKPGNGGPVETVTYTNANVNLLTALGSTSGTSISYTYDFNGNRATRSAGGLVETYSYDRENRLISWVQRNASNAILHQYDYAYDYRTRRIQRTEDGVTTGVVFSGGTSVQEYATGQSTPSVEYVRGSDWGGGVGGMLYSLRGGQPSFAHFNGRGDVVARTDGSGALTYQASYEADGTHTVQAGSTQDRQQANTKEEDPNGLLNEGMRYRDLEANVFITRDPAGMIDGPNQYAYVAQNPWSRFDPDGLKWVKDKEVIDAYIYVAGHGYGFRSHRTYRWDEEAATTENILHSLGAGIEAGASKWGQQKVEDVRKIMYIAKRLQADPAGAMNEFGITSANDLLLLAGSVALNQSPIGKAAGLAESGMQMGAVVKNFSNTWNDQPNLAAYQFGQAAAPVIATTLLGVVVAKSGYGHLKEPNTVGPGRKTTSDQRKRILEANRQKNGGELRSDGDGRLLDPKAQRLEKGGKRSLNEPQVDHMDPRSKGGSNSNSNQQVLSFEENLKKSDSQ